MSLILRVGPVLTSKAFVCCLASDVVDNMHAEESECSEPEEKSYR